MDDTESTSTSVDDRNEDFYCNSTRSALTEGMMGVFRPAIEQLDERVRSTRVTQTELKQQIESLAEDLCRISDAQNMPYDLHDAYVKKLMNAKRRIMLVNNILQNAQERLIKVHQNAIRELAKRKALLEPNTLPPPV